MATYEVTLPQKLYNSELLDTELRAGLGVHSDGCRGRKGVYVAVLFDTAPPGSDTTAISIAQAHNASVQTATQELATAATITRSQIVDYLKTQLTSASPDTAAVKVQVKAYVDSNPRLQNALANIAALYQFDTATNAGYLRAALILIALMT